MLGSAAASAIGLYQRYGSPYKGFCCAYRARTGRRSCSAYGKTIAMRLGFIALIQALPRQFDRCRAAFKALSTTTRSQQSNPGGQSQDDQRKDKWDCDPCDACDAIDIANSVDCGGCDVPCDCSF